MDFVVKHLDTRIGEDLLCFLDRWLNEPSPKTVVRRIPRPTILAAMDCSRLQPEQVERVLAVVIRQRDYLTRLIERMRIRRFPNDDPVYRAALAAFEKTSNLCVVLSKFRPDATEDANVMSRQPWGG